eukprot:357756-Chlamydomonas_euryale.AAC.3
MIFLHHGQTLSQPSPPTDLPPTRPNLVPTCPSHRSSSATAKPCPNLRLPQIFLHHGELELFKRRAAGGRYGQLVYVPSPADTFVIGLHRWLERYGGGGPFGKVRACCPAVPVCCGAGVLVCCDAGVPVCCGAGVLVCCGAGVPVCCRAGVPVCCGAGVLVCCGAGVLVCCGAGVRVCCGAGVPVC